MLDKVKRNAFFLAAAFFLWQGWSSANAAPDPGEEEDEKKGVLKVPSISRSFLRDEGAGADAESPEDPFGLLTKALQQQAAAMEELGVTDSNLPGGGEVAVESSKLVLRLESTMHANHSWIARINGHMLRVGEALPGFDKNQPPVLVSVDGTVAKLRYDGQTITLDLTGEASVSVD